MSRYLNEIKVTEAQGAAYRRDGFVKIEGLLSKETLEKMAVVIREQGVHSYHQPQGIAADAIKNLGDLEAFGRNLGLERETTVEICQDPILVDLRKALSPVRWAYTYSLAVTVSGTKGLNWHVGLDSFNYFGPDEDGITIWCPLDPIDPKKQAGGMAYVSEQVLSGRELVKLVFRFLKQYRAEPERLKDMFTFEAAYRRVMEPLLELNKVEDSFEPGDVLIFNRHVYHRTSELLEGELKKRRAYVIRLIDESARFDPEFFFTMKKVSEVTGWQPPSTFALTLQEAGLKPGERVVGSAGVITI